MITNLPLYGACHSDGGSLKMQVERCSKWQENFLKITPSRIAFVIVIVVRILKSCHFSLHMLIGCEFYIITNVCPTVSFGKGKC
jgi:hypothetical protein